MELFQLGDPEELIELTDLLDEGSSGAVFEGIFSTQRCAVKVIPGLDQPMLHKEITHEIALLREIGTSNELFVKMLGAWEKEQHAWVCLELCELGSVIDLCQVCQTNLQMEELRVVTRSVLLALQFLHEYLGVVHRDVKGKNILLTSTGQVKLTDFGVAVRLEVNEDVEPAGSPHWMAPELVSGGSNATGFGNDVWSLGITMIELYEGEPPHCEVLNPVEVLDVIANSPAPTLKSVNDELAEFLSLCLQKESRPTVRQLLEHASGFASNERCDLQAVPALCARAMPIVTSYRHFQKTGALLPSAAAAEEEQPLVVVVEPQPPPPMNRRESLINLYEKLERLEKWQAERAAVGTAGQQPRYNVVEDDLVRVRSASASSLVHTGEAATKTDVAVSYEESIRMLNENRTRKPAKSIRNVRELQSSNSDGAQKLDKLPPTAPRKTTALRLIKSMLQIGSSDPPRAGKKKS